jgi:hypothetical protein
MCFKPGGSNAEHTTVAESKHHADSKSLSSQVPNHVLLSSVLQALKMATCMVCTAINPNMACLLRFADIAMLFCFVSFSDLTRD